MIVDGERLIISVDMDLQEVNELKNFIEPRLEYIEEIVLEDDKIVFMTSSLIQLLVSVKLNKPSIKIPILEEQPYSVEPYGKIYWKLPWTKNS
ncbi:MAG: hypothetical protein QG567_2235 [Campylobacterota bacterium]|nr:hypothetical protein [Campylobacterota bacterium]